MIEEDDLVPRRPKWWVRGIAILAALLLLGNLARIGFQRTSTPEPPTPTPTATAMLSPSPSPDPSPTRTRTGDPLASMPRAIREVAREVERIRGLRFLEPVDVQIVTQRQLVERLHVLIDEYLTPSEVARSGRTWKTLGLMPQDGDLMRSIRALNAGGVAGFYDEETGELLVQTSTPDRLSPNTRYYVAHELTHALTDQHHSLAPLRELADEPDGADASSAFRALIEGDAVLVADIYAGGFTSDEQTERRRENATRNRSSLAQVPPAMLEVFGFPYRRGPPFVARLHAQGGFAAIDRAYRKPPGTTAEIIHPSRYPAPPPRHPPLAPMPSGWTELEANALGEFDLALLLKRNPNAPSVPASVADRAADGWTGGSFRTVGHDGQTVVEMQVRFRNASEAREAADAMDQNLRSRTGSNARYEQAGWSGWTGSGVFGAVRVVDNRVRILVSTSRNGLDAHVAAR